MGSEDWPGGLKWSHWLRNRFKLTAGGRGSVMLATHATSKFSHFACCSVVIFTAQQCSRQRFRDPSTRFASFTWAGRGLSADHLWPNEIALPVVGLKSKTVGTIRKKQMHVKRAINLEDILARPMYSLQRCTEDMPWRKCCTMRVVTDRRPSWIDCARVALNRNLAAHGWRHRDRNGVA